MKRLLTPLSWVNNRKGISVNNIRIFKVFSFLCVIYSSMVIAQVPTQINVEIDWMEDATHSHKPSQAEIDAVIQMFACQGITLNVDISDSVAHTNVLQRNPSNSNSFFGYTGANSFGAFKAANQNNTGAGWHYCIFAHQYQDGNYNTTTSSGLGETGGDDFTVTLGAFSSQIGTSWDRAATFAHELGHNLGLGHAGTMDDDTVGSSTLNLMSIMSYRFQLRGVKTIVECLGLAPAGLHLFKNLDYSHGKACSLNENVLDEEFGLGIVQVDWDCNGSINSYNVTKDLSNSRDNDYGWCSAGGTYHTISDYDEWANIIDNSFDLKTKTAVFPTISCITSEEDKMVAASFTCNQPTLVTESCINDNMYYVDYNAGGSHNGKCTNPFSSISNAQSSAGSGDYLYIFPGNYPEAGLVLTKRLLITGPGNIVIGK